jgi:hypothetical protein
MLSSDPALQILCSIASIECLDFLFHVRVRSAAIRSVRICLYLFPNDQEKKPFGIGRARTKLSEVSQLRLNEQTCTKMPRRSHQCRFCCKSR